MCNNVIFDLDGTLLDTSEGIIESVQYTAEKLKMKQLTEKKLRSFIGPPLKKSFIDICNCTETEAQKAVIVLLSLLYLGVKNIHLGPTLPAFLSPNVAKVLVDNFGISGIGTVEEDIELFFGK